MSAGHPHTETKVRTLDISLQQNLQSRRHWLVFRGPASWEQDGSNRRQRGRYPTLPRVWSIDWGSSGEAHVRCQHRGSCKHVSSCTQTVLISHDRQSSPSPRLVPGPVLGPGIGCERQNRRCMYRRGLRRRFSASRQILLELPGLPRIPKGVVTCQCSAINPETESRLLSQKRPYIH